MAAPKYSEVFAAFLILQLLHYVIKFVSSLLASGEGTPEKETNMWLVLAADLLLVILVDRAVRQELVGCWMDAFRLAVWFILIFLVFNLPLITNTDDISTLALMALFIAVDVYVTCIVILYILDNEYSH